MLTYLRRLSDERNSLTALANSLSERAATDERDLSDAEREQMRGWAERCATLDAQIEEHNAQVASQRAWASLQQRLEADDAESAQQPQRAGSVVQTRSWGESFTDSGAFRSFSGRGSSESVEVPFETRAVIDTSLYPLQPAAWAGPQPASFPTPLLDAISSERVSAGVVEWILFAPNPVAEAAVVAEGALKPEMPLTATPKSAALVTYAHWKAITRQALEDIPRIQSIVETRLRNGLSRALESAVAGVLNGAGSGIPELDAEATMLASIRVAMSEVQLAGYSPNAVLLNPADWASIDLALLGQTLNGPVVNGNAFGVRFIASPDVTAGEAFVGDFRTGVTLFDRGVANVFMTDSHADFFLRNQLVILAETRALPAVVEPTALVHVAPAGP